MERLVFLVLIREGILGKFLFASTEDVVLSKR